MERAHLFVVRQPAIDAIESGPDLLSCNLPGNDSGQISAPVPHQYYVLGPGQLLQDFIFNRLGSNVVARSEDNQILNPPNNPPIAAGIDLALISSVEPAIAQGLGGFIGTLPVPGKNV